MSDEFDDAIDAEVLAGRPAPGEAPAPTAIARRPSSPARLVARLYAAAEAPLRRAMLTCLLRPLGPLGIAAISAGAFVGAIARRGSDDAVQWLDDLGRFSNEQIVELARFVEQVSPDALSQVASLVADARTGRAAFSASVAMLLLRVLQRGRGDATRVDARA